MKKENKKIPQIRFKGFDTEWKEEKLGDICDFSKGHGYSKKDLTSEGTPVYLYGQMYTNYKTSINSSNLFVHPQIGSVYSTGKEVILPGSGETPEDIARATAVLSKGIILGGDLNIVYPPKELSQIFLALSISYKKNRNKLAEQAQGATITHLHNTDISKLSIAYPCNSEQTKLGTLFSEIDSLITSTQKEYDKLAALKKCMLQKMFPKKGCFVPEIRFEGFTDNWEEKKLGEVTEQTAEFTDPGKENIELWSLTIKDGLTPKTERYIRDFLVLKDDNYKKIYPGEIAYNPMNMPLGAVGFNTSNKAVAVSGYYVTMKTKNCDAAYLKTWMKTKPALDLYKSNATGSLIEKQRVQYPTFSQIKTLFPTIAEQRKIGLYFQNLEHLILQQSTEIEKLKNLKKTLLRKMFV